MQPSVVSFVLDHPSVFFGNFIVYALPSALFAYGIVWFFMRPKGQKIDNPVLWHIGGVLAADIGGALFRIIAMATFAGRSAYDPPAAGGVAGFYMLVVPAIIAAGYIMWLKKRNGYDGDITHSDVRSRNGSSNTAKIPPQSGDPSGDEYYKQVSEELVANKIDNVLWTKSLAMGEGDEQKTKAYYIGFRVKQLKQEDEEARREWNSRSNSTTTGAKGNNKAILVAAVIAGIGVLVAISVSGSKNNQQQPNPEINPEAPAPVSDTQIKAPSSMPEQTARGVSPPNIPSEFSTLINAAGNGDVNAQYNLGVIYYEGDGVQKDYAQAAQWFQKAADQGFAKAQFNLGNHYNKGDGVLRDGALAVYWYRKAAEQGFAKAQYNLGNQYTFGNGVPEDYAQAALWYRKAAEQGDSQAQLALGLNYKFGEGVPKNLVIAYMWINVSTVGDAKNIKALDEAAAMMTPTQIEQAQALTRDWVAQHKR